MVASSAQSQDGFHPASQIFMESPPARLPTGWFADGRELIRRVVIAAATATMVYVALDLVIGSAG